MLVLSSDPVIKTLTRAEDVFIARPAWLSPGEYVYTADGLIWRRGIAQVTRRPVHLFAAVAVDMHEPPPFTEPLDAAGSSPAFGVTGRSFSGDGKRGLYTALGDLWLTEGRGSDRQLTNDEFVDVDAALSGDASVLWLTDRRGRRVGVPAEKIAYVEIGSAESSSSRTLRTASAISASPSSGSR